MAVLVFVLLWLVAVIVNLVLYSAGVPEPVPLIISGGGRADWGCIVATLPVLWTRF